LKPSHKHLFGIFILIVFVGFRYLGDYPAFLQDGLSWVLQIDMVNVFMNKLAGLMSFNPPNSAWLTSRFVVMAGFGLNYLILTLFINRTIAKTCFILSLSLIILSALLSPFQFIETRRIIYQFTSIASQPFLILLVFPLWRLYQYNWDGQKN